MSIILAALLAQSAPVRVAPPPVIMSSPDIASDDELKVVERVAIQIQSGSALLWQGQLAVARGLAAHFRQDWSDILPGDCPNTPARQRMVSHRLNVTLNHADYGREGADRFTFNLEWSRPGDADSCPSPGQRTVQMSQAFVLKKGQTLTLTGDAGLRITLRRSD